MDCGKVLFAVELEFGGKKKWKTLQNSFSKRSKKRYSAALGHWSGSSLHARKISLPASALFFRDKHSGPSGSRMPWARSQTKLTSYSVWMRGLTRALMRMTE
jgi:hypothetical protein